MRRAIIVQLSFEAWHKWPQAPSKHSYLRARHRHVFHVKAEMTVTNATRDVEFIELKRNVSSWCNRTLYDTNKSCEQMAEDIAKRFGFDRVEVYEDGENGGLYEQDSNCK